MMCFAYLLTLSLLPSLRVCTHTSSSLPLRPVTSLLLRQELSAAWAILSLTPPPSPLHLTLRDDPHYFHNTLPGVVTFVYFYWKRTRWSHIYILLSALPPPPPHAQLTPTLPGPHLTLGARVCFTIISCSRLLWGAHYPPLSSITPPPLLPPPSLLHYQPNPSPAQSPSPRLHCLPCVYVCALAPSGVCRDCDLVSPSLPLIWRRSPSLCPHACVSPPPPPPLPVDVANLIGTSYIDVLIFAVISARVLRCVINGKKSRTEVVVFVVVAGSGSVKNLIPPSSQFPSLA
ncbi:hypothetical protein LPMP_292110 [Leishmania panamensis]|uniref:Uncharacterized protein n=1 Tax=Leishmania panamensis TaxID=5679 RepID=A0A088RVL8_LEIPA|nr:hypothetical protein LPMP_292110 [Leishmania panamensis]AIO00158.1 hypothetical protein LPMP_292110 [Leishmania panamensis]